MNTKNVLMLVVLSAGMLTALTASAMSQGQTAFADDKNKCKDNGDNNCNEKEQKADLKNDNCKAEVENKDHSNGGGNEADVSCSNDALLQDKSAFCPLTDVRDNSGSSGSSGADTSSCPVTPSNNQQ